MKTIKFLFTDLNQDERQILGGVVTFIVGIIFLIWLQSTNRPPILAEEENKPSPVRSYELPKSYTKYAQHCYEYNN